VQEFKRGVDSYSQGSSSSMYYERGSVPKLFADAIINSEEQAAVADRILLRLVQKLDTAMSAGQKNYRIRLLKVPM